MYFLLKSMLNEHPMTKQAFAAISSSVVYFMVWRVKNEKAMPLQTCNFMLSCHKNEFANMQISCNFIWDCQYRFDKLYRCDFCFLIRY